MSPLLNPHRRATLRDAILAGLVASGLVALVVVLAQLQGCSTVTPAIVEPTAPSYSGNAQNSGVIQRLDDGWLIDGNLRARYNALIAIYGRDFLPPLTPDAGVTKVSLGATPGGERWLIDFEHFDVLLKMNVKRHSGIAPSKS